MNAYECEHTLGVETARAWKRPRTVKLNNDWKKVGKKHVLENPNAVGNIGNEDEILEENKGREFAKEW